MNLKDLQREASSVRNSILKLEYANRAVLNANAAPLDTLKWAGIEVTDALRNFSENENLIYLNQNTVSRIDEIKDLFYERDFDAYYEQIENELSEVRQRLYNTTLELELQDMTEQGLQSDPGFKTMVKIQEDVRTFILWHRPLADSFVSVTNSIISEVQDQIATIILQTGITVFVGIFLSLFLIIALYRNMIKKLRSVNDGIRKISSGDLLTRINIESEDELGTIGQNFNLLTETIWHKVNNIGSIIHNMGQSLSSEADALVLEQSILDLAIENTHADSGALYIPDHEERTILCKTKTSNFATPYDHDDMEESIPFGKTVIGISVLSGEPLFLRTLKGQNLIPERGLFDKGYISSCLILPLVSEKTVIALLCLQKNNENQFFSDMDYSNIQSFVEFSAVTLNNLAQYKELLKSSGLNREMEIASDIQKSLLPPRLPRVDGFDLSVKTYTQKGISGEIYDFFPLGVDRWLFCLAEVEEKGIASSMLLVILRTLVRILVKPEQEPAEMLNNILDNFHETTGLDTNIKISLCLMEPKKKVFHFCGTSDQKMILFDRKSETMKLVSALQKEEGRFISVKGTLRKDVFLLMMTDGFHRTLNEENQMYGWDPPQRILKQYGDHTADWLQDAINKDLAFFERNLGQRDDRTLFIAKYKGASR
jgi:sigma-B regulation protein RsbU (phosphoserine phosphatase)